LPTVEGRVGIGNASRVSRECASPDWTRRFIRGLGRGCKVRVKPESHHRPSRRCRTRGNPRTHLRYNRKDGESGQPDDLSPEPLDAEFRGNPERSRKRGWKIERPGQPGGSITGTARGCEVRGNPETHCWHRWRVRNSGQPGDPRAGGAEGQEESGQPGASPFDTADGHEIRGNSEIRQSELPEDAEFGATRRCIGGDAGRRGTGATRSFASGTAEGCEWRGNSTLRRRHSH